MSPWRAVAADRGLVVRTRRHPPERTARSTSARLDAALGPHPARRVRATRRNAVGTINPVAEIVRRAHAVGALAYVDAVHFAPHGSIDVAALDTDFLVRSVYKWFGPHLGALYGKAEVLDRLPAYKVRPADDRFETGTAPFELVRRYARDGRVPAEPGTTLRRPRRGPGPCHASGAASWSPR